MFGNLSQLKKQLTVRDTSLSLTTRLLNKVKFNVSGTVTSYIHFSAPFIFGSLFIIFVILSNTHSFFVLKFMCYKLLLLSLFNFSIFSL